jgi:DNA-binding NtrC family response regulator
MVANGSFRQDLYYRIAGVSLMIPPLRERVEEIPRLANEFVAKFCRENKRPIIPISDGAMQQLKMYTWPGNVRELRNTIERAIVFCKGIAIAPEHLGLPTERNSRPPTPAARISPSQPPSLMGPTPSATASTIAFGSNANLPAEMADLERERILTALAQCGGNQTQAAEMLGISRRTLLRRLDEYAVPRPRK